MAAGGSSIDRVDQVMSTSGAIGVPIVPDANTVVPTSPSAEELQSQIFVRSWHGTCLLKTNLNSGTVEALKCLIKELEGIPVDIQYLIHGSTPLRDGTLLRDYAILEGSTVQVFPRMLVGRSDDIPLDESLFSMMTKHVRVSVSDDHGTEVVVKVLNEFGVRILRGIISCVLKKHKAMSAFPEDQFRRETLRPSVAQYYRHRGARWWETTDDLDKGVRLWETATVNLYNIRATETLDDNSQRDNYKQLCDVIVRVFGEGGYPLHVDSIVSVLRNLSQPNPSLGVAQRTQLLEALAATLDPVQMASMWWNLVRFQESLSNWKQRQRFRDAVESTEETNWYQSLNQHPLFQKVYHFKTPSYNPRSAMDLLFFARHWFTHVPKEQWENGVQQFQGLPHLDYIFTHHFTKFLANLLLRLIEGKFNLAEFLIPLS